MLFSSVLVGLAFSSGVIARLNSDSGKPQGPCPYENPTTRLIPDHAYISTQQESLFKDLVGGIVSDLKALEKKTKRGGQKKAIKNCKKKWEAIYGCIPTYQNLGEEHYNEALQELKSSLNTFGNHRKTKNDPEIKKLQYNILHNNLQLVGLFNELHGTEEIPQYLTDRPGDVLGKIIHDLGIDVTKPLAYKPKPKKAD